MRSTFLMFLSLFMVLAGSITVHAVQPDEVLPDARLEARARDISSHLRCLVCQNESIDDSNAPLARDLRLLVRERLVAGDSNQQVVDFLVARYGEFVLLRPRFNRDTLLLWGAPAFLVIIAGGIIFWRVQRRKHKKLMPLNEDEKKRLNALLNGG